MINSICQIEAIGKTEERTTKKTRNEMKSIQYKINQSNSNGKISQYTSINYANHLPSLPTMKLISDMSSLLNIAAFRSRTVGFVACQFGSPVSMVNMVFGIVNDVELSAL